MDGQETLKRTLTPVDYVNEYTAVVGVGSNDGLELGEMCTVETESGDIDGAVVDVDEDSAWVELKEPGLPLS